MAHFICSNSTNHYSVVTLVTGFTHGVYFLLSPDIGRMGGGGGHGWNRDAFRGRMQDILDMSSPIDSFAQLIRTVKDGLGDDRNNLPTWRQEQRREGTFSYTYKIADGQLFLADGRSFRKTFITRVRELGPERGVVVDEAELNRLELLEQSLVNGSRTVYTAAGDRGNYRYLQKWEKTEAGRVRMTSFDIASVVGQDLTQTQAGDVIRVAIGVPEKKSLDRDGLLYATKTITPQLGDFFEKATRYVTSPREAETQANVFSDRSSSFRPDIQRQRDESRLHVLTSQTPSEESNQHANDATYPTISELEPVVSEKTTLTAPPPSTHQTEVVTISNISSGTTRSLGRKEQVRPYPSVFPIVRKKNVADDEGRTLAYIFGFLGVQRTPKASLRFNRNETRGGPKSQVSNRTRDVAIRFERSKQIVKQLSDVFKSLPRRVERRVETKVAKWQLWLTQFTAKKPAAGTDNVMSFGTKHRPLEVEKRGYRGLEKIGNYVKERTMVLRQWINMRKKRGISFLPFLKEANPSIAKKTIPKLHKERPFLIQVSELGERMKLIRYLSVLTTLIRVRLTGKEKKGINSTPSSLSREGVPMSYVSNSAKQRREGRLTWVFTKIMSVHQRDAITLLALVGKRMKETAALFRKPVAKQAGKWQWSHKSEANRYKINMPATDRISMGKVVQTLRLHIFNRYRVLLQLLSLRSEESLPSALLTTARVSTGSHKEDGNFIFRVYTSFDSFLLSLYLLWLKRDSQLKTERPHGIAFGQPRVPAHVKRHPIGIIYLRLVGQRSGSVVVA